MSSTLSNPRPPMPQFRLPVRTEEPGEGPTYRHILKSTALVGGSSILKIAVQIIRTKAMAILLGPGGFGLFGLYGAVSDLWLSVAGMGVNSSGVRQIAEAAGSGNIAKIAKTTAVLRRTSIMLGIIGSLLLAIFSKSVSTLTFGGPQHSTAIAVLSIVILFRLISDGQAALIQGKRRIADLAKMNAIGAISGTLISIPMVYMLGEDGVVPSLVAVAATTILTSWWYSRKIQIPPAPVTLREVGEEAASLLKLGFVFMSSGLMTMGAAYIVRVLLLRKLGVGAAGLYQSAWTLGGLYVGFILQAMGADFYPRLTASSKNDTECNRLVNEQALVGLLLAGPGLIATLTFAPLVIYLFYSAKFGAAGSILRWICLGTTLQVISWPMGFIIIAKARKGFYFVAEFVWAVAAVILAWTCITYFGLTGAGMAFFASYGFHAVLIYSIVRHLSGFRWSPGMIHTSMVFLVLLAAVTAAIGFLPVIPASCIGAVALGVSCVYSIHTLRALVGSAYLPRPLAVLWGRTAF